VKGRIWDLDLPNRDLWAFFCGKKENEPNLLGNPESENRGIWNPKIGDSSLHYAAGIAAERKWICTMQQQ
jgi:hypothetical protein